MARLAEISVAKILHSEEDIRKTNAELGIGKLARSVEGQGLLQPIIVCPKGDDYELIVGLQRLTVMEKLGKETVTAMVIDPKEKNMTRLISLLENLQFLMK